MPMTKRQADKRAKELLGPKAEVRLNRRVTWNEADRVKARVELAEIRASKPVRPDWLAVDDDAKRAYHTAFRAFREREEKLMTIALSTRVDVGVHLAIVAGFAAFGVRGSGDTYEDALADVERKNPALVKALKKTPTRSKK